MNNLQSFFLFCSGANLTMLSRTPSEFNKYVGIGATIFFTGLFAFVASAYAMYTVFDSYLVSVLFGMLWGAMIFNLDRYIVSTMKKKGNFFGDFFRAGPRVILAIMIAIVIAKPLELKIFQSEIDAELSLMQLEHDRQQESAIIERYAPQLAAVQHEIDLHQGEIQNKIDVRNGLVAAAVVEADGTGGSMRRNLGPIYKVKRAAADQAAMELEGTENRLRPLINENRSTLATLQANQQAEITNMASTPLTGFASRIEALDRAANKSEAILIASIFIMLLFIAIETAPIFVKLITERSPYDLVLDKHEHRFAMNHKMMTSSLSNATKHELDFQIRTNGQKTELAVQAENELSKQAVQEHVERLKKQPMLWRELLRKGKLYGLE